MYKESMNGATAKSTPSASKIDEKEMRRLHKQDYWLLITRTKLMMDLIFVCKYYQRDGRLVGVGANGKMQRTTCSD